MIRYFYVEEEDTLIRELVIKDANYEYLEILKKTNNFILSKGGNKNLFKLRSYILKNRFDKNSLLLGIFNKNIHIGNIRIHDIKKIGILGVMIDENYTGKNIFGRALKMIEKKLKLKLKINKIYLGVDKKIYMQLKHLKKRIYKRKFVLQKNKKSNYIFKKNILIIMKLFQNEKNLLKGYEALKQNKFKNILHLRSLIEEKFKLKKNIFIFSHLIKNIDYEDFLKNIKSNFIYENLNYNFNKKLLLSLTGKKFDFAMPTELNLLIKNENYTVSIFNNIFGNFFLIKHIVKQYLKVIYKIRLF